MKNKTQPQQTKGVNVETLANTIANLSGYEGNGATIYERGIVVGYEKALLDNKNAVNMHDELIATIKEMLKEAEDACTFHGNNPDESPDIIKWRKFLKQAEQK